MGTLDLHGVRHHEVDRLVENFIIMGELPVKIITGNSPIMRAIVFEVVERHGYYGDYESYWNLGAIIVCERR